MLDENGRYKSDVKSSLNSCLTVSANLDQTPRAFLQDLVLSLFDKGAVAIVPTHTSSDPDDGPFDIYAMRVGEIIEWRPKYVVARVYNDDTGEYEDVVVSKETTPIIENPFFAVMNEPNSTMKRLSRKLSLLDVIDSRLGSNRLDLIIQLPFSTRHELKRKEAEQRLSMLTQQLTGSPFGIGYIDGSEKVVQLNRPVENNLLNQIEYLTSMLYSQLGITPEIMNGQADEKTMLNYNTRIIEPIISVICDSMDRCWISKTARTQGNSIMFFKDPFKLVPVDNIAEIADKFTRNEILTSNEVRQIVGIKPSSDPSADELRNKNLSQPDDAVKAKQEEVVVKKKGQNEIVAKVLERVSKKKKEE